jgi:GNAT superfamily N-acetyltransferase
VFVTKDLTPQLWPDLEKLFGDNGACGGCWCMYWRQKKGEPWDEVKGSTAKRRFSSLVKKGLAHGVIAYDDGEPVGWCSYDRRTDFERLERARTLACDDADAVWSIPCFFVKASHRGRGVAGALLEHAVSALEKRGAEIIEGYPVKPKSGAKMPAAFAWTGTVRLFRAHGFEAVGSKDAGKQRMRRTR